MENIPDNENYEREKTYEALLQTQLMNFKKAEKWYGKNFQEESCWTLFPLEYLVENPYPGQLTGNPEIDKNTRYSASPHEPTMVPVRKDLLERYSPGLLHEKAIPPSSVKWLAVHLLRRDYTVDRIPIPLEECLHEREIPIWEVFI